MAGQRQDGCQDQCQDGSIPIAEAAELLGLSQEAVRKRLQRGSLAGEKVDGAWYVLLDRQDVRTAGRQDNGRTERQDIPPIEAPYQVTPAEVERAIERTGARYVADFAALYDRISAEVGRLYEGQLAAKDETIAELRHRASLAESSRLLHEPVIAAQEATIAAKDQTITELQQRAEVAEAEAGALRAPASAPVVAQDETSGADRTPELSDAENAPGAGLWGRVRRWWAGES